MLGEAFMKIDESEQAMKAYAAASKESPQDASVASQVGHALVATHNYGKAMEHYESALPIVEDGLAKLDLCYDVAGTYYLYLLLHLNVIYSIFFLTRAIMLTLLCHFGNKHVRIFLVVCRAVFQAQKLRESRRAVEQIACQCRGWLSSPREFEKHKNTHVVSQGFIATLQSAKHTAKAGLYHTGCYVQPFDNFASLVGFCMSGRSQKC